MIQDSTISPVDTFLKVLKAGFQRYLNTHVHSSIIYNI